MGSRWYLNSSPIENWAVLAAKFIENWRSNDARYSNYHSESQKMEKKYFDLTKLIGHG